MGKNIGMVTYFCVAVTWFADQCLNVYFYAYLVCLCTVMLVNPLLVYHFTVVAAMQTDNLNKQANSYMD